MTAEEWRPIPGCPGYFASNQGRVLSTRRKKPVVLRPCDNGQGYLLVGLTGEDGRRRGVAVHRAVASAFLGPKPDGMETCHRDGNRTNNAPSNLRYDTTAANALDRVSHGSDRNARKTHCPRQHPYDEVNTLVSSGRRFCRACRSKRAAANVRSAAA